MSRFTLPILRAAVIVGLLYASTAMGQPLAREKALDALERAATFFNDVVAVEGGYLWLYSADLERQEGEGKVGATTAWVQPPGTPAVGDALLTAYEKSRAAECLVAARRAADALLRGQLESGGWDYRIEFAPEERLKYAYRLEGNPSGRNTTTLDDNTTQAAVTFLMHLDRALEFNDPRVHEAVMYALEALLKAQYPNGAWPQRFDALPKPEDYPVKNASYPAEWSRVYEQTDYKGYYTLNDNTLADMIELMLEAHWIYEDARYLEAAKNGGAFLIRAQMPDPQPAWAQQYDAEMHPAWARKFEPPAVTGGESHGAMRILLRLYRATGEKRFLDPIPKAIAYLKSSLRPDGRLARFYELQTNKPLYFTIDYQLTYSDSDMPTHYSFVVDPKLDVIEAEYNSLREMDPAARVASLHESPTPNFQALASRAIAAANALDDRGAWVEAGSLRYHGEDDPTEQVIDARTFIRNIETLSGYVALAGGPANKE